MGHAILCAYMTSNYTTACNCGLWTPAEIKQHNHKSMMKKFASPDYVTKFIEDEITPLQDFQKEFIKKLYSSTYFSAESEKNNEKPESLVKNTADFDGSGHKTWCITVMYGDSFGIGPNACDCGFNAKVKQMEAEVQKKAQSVEGLSFKHAVVDEASLLPWDHPDATPVEDMKHWIAKAKDANGTPKTSLKDVVMPITKWQALPFSATTQLPVWPMYAFGEGAALNYMEQLKEASEHYGVGVRVEYREWEEIYYAGLDGYVAAGQIEQYTKKALGLPPSQKTSASITMSMLALKAKTKPGNVKTADGTANGSFIQADGYYHCCNHCPEKNHSALKNKHQVPCNSCLMESNPPNPSGHYPCCACCGECGSGHPKPCTKGHNNQQPKKKTCLCDTMPKFDNVHPDCLQHGYDDAPAVIAEKALKKKAADNNAVVFEANQTYVMHGDTDNLKVTPLDKFGVPLQNATNSIKSAKIFFDQFTVQANLSNNSLKKVAEDMQTSCICSPFVKYVAVGCPAHDSAEDPCPEKDCELGEGHAGSCKPYTCPKEGCEGVNGHNGPHTFTF